MPGGPSVTAPFGLAVFAAVKLVGYSAYALYLNRLFPENRRNALYVGFCRTAIGLGFGTVLALFGLVAAIFAGPVGIGVYVIGLIPLRVLEWWIIISEMYDIEWRTADVKKSLAFGVLTSFLLDAPALAGLIATDPFWIC